MYKRHITLIAFLFITLLVQAGFGHAYAQQGQNLVLRDEVKNIDISTYIYVTSDSLGELSAQDVVQRFKNNIRGRKNSSDLLQLDSKNGPYWLAFSVRNNSESDNWILDLGDIVSGRSGSVQKLLVYEGGARKVYFDGLSQNAKQAKGNWGVSSVPLELRHGVESIIVLYVDTSAYLPVILAPKIVESGYFLSNIHQSKGDVMTLAITIAIAISGIMMLLGYVYTQSLGFVPFVAFYLLSFMWFSAVDAHVYSNLSGADVLSPVFIIVQSILILTGCFLSIPSTYRHTNFKVATIVTIVLSITALIALMVVGGYATSLKALIANVVAISACMVGCFYMAVNWNEYTRKPSYLLLAWVAIFLAGYAVTYMSIMGYLPYSWVGAQAYNLSYIPQMILVFVGIFLAIEGENKRRVADVIKKAQKAQTLLKAKQSKEASDQSRLLRVIEREREIMEELRGREAERSEEMRQAKILADEANNAKSAFLAVVSHEIRTPMTGIMGMLRLLEDTDLSRVQKEYAMTIKDSGDAMLALLNDILDFSKIEGGGMDLEKIDFDLKRVLNGVQMLMRGHADQKNLKLLLDVDQDIPVGVVGDPTRMRQIFLNLVGNALKFTSKGHVKLIAKIDADHNGHAPDQGKYALYFAVEDTGIGISEEAQKNLFQPFAQADSSIARKYGGTGLGLAICKRLIEAMGSRIQIHSREGLGTTFYFTVVMDANRGTVVDHNDSGQQAVRPIKPMRVLVVDDNAINRKVVAGLLSRDGHSLESAATGQETLDILNKDPKFDTILLDIELPDISGIDVCKTIKTNETTAAIPVIALTGNVSDDDMAIYRKVGMVDRIVKPIDPDRLRQVIVSLAEGADKKTVQENAPEDDDSFATAVTKVEEQERASERQSSKATALLDENMLKGLRDGLGGPQTKELIEGLFEKTREILPQIQEAYARQDRDSVRARAHELKGMAGNFGLSGLSEKAAMIERLCRDEESSLDDTKEYIELLESTAERSAVAVDKFLEG